MLCPMPNIAFEVATLKKGFHVGYVISIIQLSSLPIIYFISEEVALNILSVFGISVVLPATRM